MEEQNNKICINEKEYRRVNNLSSICVENIQMQLKRIVKHLEQINFFSRIEDDESLLSESEKYLLKLGYDVIWKIECAMLVGMELEQSDPVGKIRYQSREYELLDFDSLARIYDIPRTIEDGGHSLTAVEYMLSKTKFIEYLKKYLNHLGTDEPRTISEAIEYVLGILVIVQWNLVTYIFPTRTFWGYAPMFVLITAFFFHTKSVLFEITGISISIAISWMIIGDKLLPYRDELFLENLTLRIVSLIVAFVVIYALTFYAEKFTLQVKSSFKDIEEKNEELENMSRDIIDFTADIIEERDFTSGSHVKRLKVYTKILANQIANDWPEYGLNDEKVERISLACVLHDIGKIGIPDSILLKPEKLTKEEFDTIKLHTTIGAQIVTKLPDSVGAEYKKCCKEICLYHHEKYDGKGYPIGLKGDDIPISAQIVSVVDCFDALVNARPYKPALPGEVAIKMILNGECGAFSEKVKESIINCKEKLLEI